MKHENHTHLRDARCPCRDLTPLIIPIIAMDLLVIWRHRGNIQRLRFGTESKIKLTKK